MRAILMKFVLLLCISGELGLAEVPMEARVAWRKNRVALLDLDPVRLSSVSFSAEIESDEVWEVRDRKTSTLIRSGGTKSRISVAKLGKAFLFTSIGPNLEERQLFVDGDFYRLRRSVGSNDWNLVERDKYTEVDQLSAEPFRNKLFKAARLQNERILGLWSMANYSFNELEKMWRFGDSIVEANVLKISGFPVKEKVVSMEFLIDKEYRLGKVTDIVMNSERVKLSERVTHFSDVSDDFLGFSATELSDSVSNGEHHTSKVTYKVRINRSAPDAKLFDLENYSIRFQQPLPTNWGAKLNWGLIIGIALIVFAVYLKFRR